jgi:hypothetical protein
MGQKSEPGLLYPEPTYGRLVSATGWGRMSDVGCGPDTPSLALPQGGGDVVIP